MMYQPSPLEGEGGPKGRERGCRCDGATPLPSLRDTLSRKGRGFSIHGIQFQISGCVSSQSWAAFLPSWSVLPIAYTASNSLVSVFSV